MRRRIYLVGGCLLVVACVAIWTDRTMNTTPIVVSGRVADASGKPVAQARVYFTDGPAPLPDLALLTDMNGRFSLSVPKPGTYQLGCAADGFANAAATVEVTGNQDSPVVIRLRK